MEKLVKTRTQGYRIEGWEKYFVKTETPEGTIEIPRIITWMRYVTEREANEFMRRRLFK